MKEIKEYHIIEHATKDSLLLAREVNNYIEKGWQPSGNLVVTSELIYQVMVLLIWEGK